ncbi:hypothetical protein K2173_004225 [Erythroxylum novogranatense]|uniref:U3 small nucleolar RNA-associated protein 14 n=1 Tax=Erythroxylum novogranatense TaxID=1862640 RepID=A0AAV8UBJ0_9ROSI|nr:hypothetical protein K2173_004225 [Erythroxylum novogranatense]
MVDKKRKTRDDSKNSKHKTLTFKRSKGDRGKSTQKKRGGPRLPNALRKELDRVNPKNQFNSGEEDEDISSDEGNDFYEYEEGVPEEESKKNRRYDPVDNYEYELPDQFQDENVQSDDDSEYNADENNNGGLDFKRRGADHVGSDREEDDEEGHVRMLQDITGLPREAIEGKKNRRDVVVSEPYPESEYNPTRDVLDGNGRITLEDLLEGLEGKPGYSQLRKRTHQMQRKFKPLQAPLPKEVQDRLERKAAYEKSKKDITKWEPLVKRNREAPTIIFDKDIDLGFSTIGAIASEFEPRTEFEKQMASLVYDKKVMDAYKEDGARLLELNKISVEDYRDRQNHIAKMRSLLFRHEMKMKRVKNIKSKTYHRLLKKDKKKAAFREVQMDPEAAKELAMKQEYKRAEERLTLRHKNSSRWAKRILERGLNVQDEGTRAALAEQLHQHSLLTRKMNSMKDNSSSDESTDEEDDEDLAGSDEAAASKLLTKAKEKTVKVLEEDDEQPSSGVLSLPFMVRGLKKRKEAAAEEAKIYLEEYESSLKQLEDTSGVDKPKPGAISGRRVFGVPRKQTVEPSRVKLDNSSENSGSDSELDANKNIHDGLYNTNNSQDIKVKSVSLDDNAVSPRDSELKSLQNLDDIVAESGPKTTYDVAIFVSDTWKKQMGTQNDEDRSIDKSPKVTEQVTQNQDLEELGEGSGSDSEGEMVDGMLSASPNSSYKLPSQAELIREAFAGDDVEEEFTKDKEEILNEENPEPEKLISVPGWGEWTHVQKKKGLPSWMVKEHESAKRKREAALKRRKDAHLKNVIISEKLDKKAEKLLTKTLPYPFTSKEVFEQSTRMPMGPEFNPATAVGALIRPEVVKKTGVIIKPIKFEDVDPYEKSQDRKNNEPKKKHKTNRSRVRTKPVVAKS